jgi:hypothetical protein
VVRCHVNCVPIFQPKSHQRRRETAVCLDDLAEPIRVANPLPFLNLFNRLRAFGSVDKRARGEAFVDDDDRRIHLHQVVHPPVKDLIVDDEEWVGGEGSVPRRLAPLEHVRQVPDVHLGLVLPVVLEMGRAHHDDGSCGGLLLAVVECLERLAQPHLVCEQCPALELVDGPGAI